MSTSTNTINLHPIDPATTILITDALHRAVLALDTNDLPLWTSAFTTATPPSFTMFNTTHTGPAVQDIFYKVNALDTTHFISNVRVSGVAGGGGIEDAEVTRAKLTASAQAFHYRPGEGVDVAKTERLVSGSLYELEVVREGDGVWRIERWEMRVVWLEGTMDVMGNS